MATVHAEVNDFVRKDGQLVRVVEIDIAEGCYFTSHHGGVRRDLPSRNQSAPSQSIL